jgi:hypothetical protein
VEKVAHQFFSQLARVLSFLKIPSEPVSKDRYSSAPKGFRMKLAGANKLLRGESIDKGQMRFGSRWDEMLQKETEGLIPTSTYPSQWRFRLDKTRVWWSEVGSGWAKFPGLNETR